MGATVASGSDGHQNHFLSIGGARYLRSRGAATCAREPMRGHFHPLQHLTQRKLAALSIAATLALGTVTTVMVPDGAGWHTAKDLRVPDPVTRVRQPAYSPESQPGRADLAGPARALRLFARLPRL